MIQTLSSDMKCMDYDDINHGGTVEAEPHISDEHTI